MQRAALVGQPEAVGKSDGVAEALHERAADTQQAHHSAGGRGLGCYRRLPDAGRLGRGARAAVDLRRFRLVTFVIAEGMENQGRFLPFIENEIAAICGETSWILSGHVKFTNGRNDLGTAMTAWNLATAATMLGDRLPAATRQAVRDAVRTRVVAPYLDAIRGKTKPEWWSTDPNNWNAVVHGGVVGAAVDAVGIVVDTAAAAVPGVPGGAGAAIKAARAADTARGRASEARKLAP